VGFPLGRAHLFRHLQLRHAGRASPENWHHFLSNSPHMLSYIKELAVLCERSSWVSWDPILPALMEKLANLQQIELHGCDLPWLPARLSSAIYTLFRSPLMRRVSLRLCVLPSSCFDLFGPALQNIALSDVAVEPDMTVAAEEDSVGSVIDWLIPSLERHELEDLEHLCLKYHGDDADALQAVERLLQCAGSSLKTLDISLYPAGLLSATTTTPRTPSDAFDMDISSPTNQLPWLGSLLSQMTTQHTVQKISIERDIDHTVDGRKSMRSSRGSHPPHLQDVHIRVGKAYGASFNRISASMPLLRAKGVLRVSM
ncbi:hypothetical protein B0H14DRAFT_2776959, partial [Mycena olivaceomarginata]